MKKTFFLLLISLFLILIVSCATRVQERSLMDKLGESAAFIKGRIGDFEPEIGIILGSGLGDLAEEITNPVIIDYRDIPNFPVSTVEGHKGRLVIGELSGRKVICMQGRFHYYEGYEMQETAYPVQVMKLLGVGSLIVTNAAGCVNRDWSAGSLMIMTDHIKLVAENPLRGINESELGQRFFDMTTAYDKDLQAIAEEQARNLGIDIKKGVYMYFSGPSFETPADIRAAAALGADAIGMSTVAEVIAARHCGIRVLGISCMTNMAAGILDQPISHEEVLETTNMVREEFMSLVKAILAAM